jgi:hypothetical protein
MDDKPNSKLKGMGLSAEMDAGGCGPSLQDALAGGTVPARARVTKTKQQEARLTKRLAISSIVSCLLSPFLCDVHDMP